MKLSQDCELLNPTSFNLLVPYCASLAQILVTSLTSLNEAGEGEGEDYEESILQPHQISPAQSEIMSSVPEYLVDDLVTMLIFVAKARADQLNHPQMKYVLELTIFFLRRPQAVQSPHVRAKFGELLYQVFLPSRERDAGPYNERWDNEHYPDGLHRYVYVYVYVYV